MSLFKRRKEKEERKIRGGHQSSLPLKLGFWARFWAKFKLLRYEILYKLHLKERFVHDIRYEKGGWYRKWSDKSYSSSIHKAAIFAFIASFIIYSISQGYFLNSSLDIKLETVEVTTTTVKIRWTTNIPSDSIVKYQPILNFGNALDEAQISGNPSLVTNHEVIIKSLLPNMTYRFRIRSVTVNKAISETDDILFTTKSFDISSDNQFPIDPTDTEITAQNINLTSVQINWLSVVPTTSMVDYGTVSGFYTLNTGHNNLSSEHSVSLNNLTPGTKYYYRIRVKDQNGTEYVSKEYSFKALPKLVISNIKISESSPFSVTISWQTNVPTDSAINLGQDQRLNQRQGMFKLTKDHKVTLTNLSDNTKYYYQIVSKDQFKSEAKSDIGEFTTPVDNSNLEVFDVKIDSVPLKSADETAQVIISYSTNKPATTLIEYDEGIISGKYGKKTTEDLSLNTAHTVIIKDLNPSTTYHFRIITKDKNDNQNISKDYFFTAPVREGSTLQLIFEAFEETFSWIEKIRKNI